MCNAAVTCVVFIICDATARADTESFTMKKELACYANMLAGTIALPEKKAHSPFSTPRKCPPNFSFFHLSANETIIWYICDIIWYSFLGSMMSSKVSVSKELGLGGRGGGRSTEYLQMFHKKSFVR